MSSNNHRIVTIKDPARWGLKYTEKRQWYFKMRLDFLTDPAVQMLKNDEKMLFLLVLNESLRVNSEIVNIVLEYCSGVLSISLDECKRYLMTLKKNNIIDLQTNVRSQLIEEKKRKENRIKQNKNFVSDIVFDFEKIYENFPRKHGKKKGIEICQKRIKTQEDYDSLMLAVNNYKAEVQDSGTDTKYIKHFSTFMNCWEDYLINEKQVLREQAEQAMIDFFHAD